jgi:hypothetical protein
MMGSTWYEALLQKSILIIITMIVSTDQTNTILLPASDTTTGFLCFVLNEQMSQYVLFSFSLWEERKKQMDLFLLNSVDLEISSWIVSSDPREDGKYTPI